jgi:hypothetical protein
VRRSSGSSRRAVKAGSRKLVTEVVTMKRARGPEGPRACVRAGATRLSVIVRVGRTSFPPYNSRGPYALTVGTYPESSPHPPALQRTDRVVGAARVADRAAGDAWRAGMESYPPARQDCTRGPWQLRRRWRGSPGGIYYPAFYTQGRGTSSSEGASTSYSPQACCGAGSRAGKA